MRNDQWHFFGSDPTSEELLAYYLDHKITGGANDLDIIPKVDLYKCEPWDLLDKSLLPGKDIKWYLYSPRDRKHPNRSRTNRATRAGYWKATGKDQPVDSHHKQQSVVVTIGMKKTLVYCRGRAPDGLRTNWVMHEYRLLQPSPSSCPYLADSYALCCVFEKTPQVIANKKVQNEPPESQVRWLSNNIFQCTPVETNQKSDSQPPVPSIEPNNFANDLLYMYSSVCNPSNQIQVQSFLIYP
ncbi:hypothetical protein NMG60_11001919 [Bertholletia excelsa]